MGIIHMWQGGQQDIDRQIFGELLSIYCGL